MDLKAALAHMGGKLAELESAARKLENQNFADIVKGAIGRLHQASEHPDLEAVEKHLRTDIDKKDDPSKFGGDAAQSVSGEAAASSSGQHGPSLKYPFDDPSKQGSG